MLKGTVELPAVSRVWIRIRVRSRSTSIQLGNLDLRRNNQRIHNAFVDILHTGRYRIPGAVRRDLAGAGKR